MEESNQSPARREGRPLPPIDRGMKPVRRLPPFWRPGAPLANPPGFKPGVPAGPTPASLAPPSNIPARPARPPSAPKPPPPAAPDAKASRPISGVVYGRRYKLEQVIGRGGRGTVYKAWDNVLGMHVALKFLPPGVTLKPEAVEEIRREAVVTMRLAHENIVRLHNIEMTGNRLFLVMEYVDGENLRQILERMGPLAPSTVVAIARSCASALAYAHRVGIVHRDLKPENVMIGKDSVLKIVDLGTAVMARTPGKDQYMEGTPGYMSPEQIRGGGTPDARTDVYSFGAVMAELLTGKRAFVYDGEMDHLLNARPQGLESLDPNVAAVLIKAMEPDREARWASAVEFCQALSAALGGDESGA